MCFSAKASFTTAVTLAFLGALSLKKARTNTLRPFAAIPLFFALQQLCEGFVWVTLNNTVSILHKISVYGFIFFATSFWPTWIPFSLYYAEQNQRRKKNLWSLLIIGSIFSLTTFFCCLLFGVKVYIVDNHIAYNFISPPLTSSILLYVYFIALGIYALPTIGSFFIASIQNARIIGLLISTAFIIALLFYYTTFGSVWCFFAAIISMVIYKSVNKRIKE